MDFRVETSAEAELDAISIFEWLISQEAGETGLRWFLSMEEAIASLAHFPERCPLAPENTQFPFEVRELLYGRRPHVFTYSDASRHYLEFLHFQLKLFWVMFAHLGVEFPTR